METRVNFTLVGLYVVVLFVGMVALGLWLSQGKHTKSYNPYQVYFNESVYGLTTQTPVMYSGVKVGYVDSIELNHENLLQVRVLLQIEEGTPITEATVATLQTQGITGITYVGLKSLTPSSQPLRAAEEEEYPTIKTTPSFLLQLTDTVRHLAANLNKITRKFSQLMSEENLVNMNKSLINIRQVTDTLAKNSENLNTSIISANKLIQNTEKASQDFPEITKKTKRALDQVQSALKSLDSASIEVKKTVQDGRVVINDISRQTLPGANNLISDMSHVTQNLRQITDDLKDNPSLLVRGKRHGELGPGEK